MEVMDYIWLGVTILAVIVEASTAALVSIWFVPGGLAALVASLLGGPLWLQFLLFAMASFAALLITRPLVKKNRLSPRESTNADMVLGKVALVTEEVDNLRSAGRVQVLGNSWSARSTAPNKVIPKGVSVRVDKIEGVKLMVTPLNSQTEKEK